MPAASRSVRHRKTTRSSKAHRHFTSQSTSPARPDDARRPARAPPRPSHAGLVCGECPIAFRSDDGYGAAVPSSLHESLVRFFELNPAFAVRLVEDITGIVLPKHREARITTTTFSELDPPELRSDVVTLLEDGHPVFAIVVEVQLSRKEEKRRSWLAFTAGLTRRLKCDVCVLVFTRDAAIANWAAQPLSFGLVSTFRPLVLGPSALPLIATAEKAGQALELAVLAVAAHGEDIPVGPVAEAADTALRLLLGLDDERALLYSDLIFTALSNPARAALEELTTMQGYEYQSEFARRHQAAGKAAGEAEAIVRFLAARGLTVTNEQRERIFACTDLAKLTTWVDKAATVASTDELFAE
jgi:hypothetical protein